MRIPNLPTDRKVSSPKDGAATDTFWLVMDALLKWVRTNGTVIYATNAQRTTPATRGYISPQTVSNGTLLVETDTGLIYQAREVSGVFSWVWIAGTRVVDLTLVAASTTINVPADGNDLVVILRQDGTGGRAIVWGAGFTCTSVNIDTPRSTVSTFRFVLSGGNWVMVGQPTTGMAP